MVRVAWWTTASGGGTRASAKPSSRRAARTACPAASTSRATAGSSGREVEGLPRAVRHRAIEARRPDAVDRTRVDRHLDRYRRDPLQGFEKGQQARGAQRPPGDSHDDHRVVMTEAAQRGVDPRSVRLGPRDQRERPGGRLILQPDQLRRVADGRVELRVSGRPDREAVRQVSGTRPRAEEEAQEKKPDHQPAGPTAAHRSPLP